MLKEITDGLVSSYNDPGCGPHTQVLVDDLKVEHRPFQGKADAYILTMEDVRAKAERMLR